MSFDKKDRKFDLINFIYELEQQQPNSYQRTIKQIVKKTVSSSETKLDYSENKLCKKIDLIFGIYHHSPLEALKEKFTKTCEDINTEVRNLKETQIKKPAGDRASAHNIRGYVFIPANFTLNDLFRNHSFFTENSSQARSGAQRTQQDDSQEETVSPSNDNCL